MTSRNIAAACLFGFLACIVLANAAIDRWGFIELGWGLTAPAGVFFAGLTFQLRDVAQEHGGIRPVVLAIILGAALSATIDWKLALASGTAFLLSESLDLAIYTPLRERQWLAAVALSGLAGAALDSWVFLQLAPFPFTGQAWLGLTFGKVIVVAIFVVLAAPARRVLAPTT